MRGYLRKRTEGLAADATAGRPSAFSSNGQISVAVIALPVAAGIAVAVPTGITISVAAGIAVAVPTSIAVAVPAGITISVASSIAIAVPAGIVVPIPTSIAVPIATSVTVSIAITGIALLLATLGSACLRFLLVVGGLAYEVAHRYVARELAIGLHHGRRVRHGRDPLPMVPERRRERT